MGLRIALVLAETLLRLLTVSRRLLAVRLLRLLTVGWLLWLLTVGWLLWLLAIGRLWRLTVGLTRLLTELLTGRLTVRRWLLRLAEPRALLPEPLLRWLTNWLAGLSGRLPVRRRLWRLTVGRLLPRCLTERLTRLLTVAGLLPWLRRIARLLRRLPVLRRRSLRRRRKPAGLRGRWTCRLLRREPLLLWWLKPLLRSRRAGRLTGCCGATSGNLRRRRSGITKHRLRWLLTARRRSRLHRRHRSTTRAAGRRVHQRGRTAVGARPSWSCHSGIPCSFELYGIAEQEVKATNRHGFGRTDRRDIATDLWHAAFPHITQIEAKPSRSGSGTPRFERIGARASLPRRSPVAPG